MKVVDRRRLDEDGEEREESAPAEQTDDRARAEAPPRPNATAGPAGPALDSAGPLPKLDFATFIQSLAQQTLMHMGVLGFEGEEPQVDLALARQSIDILQMLHEKTRGNLDADEQRLFDAVLHELRLAFVQISG